MGLTATERAAERAAKNTIARAVGEIVGKLASLALIFALAREEGASGLGVYVFAIAWGELATVPIDMGFDRYFVRQVARNPASMHDLFFNVYATKLLRAVPIVALSFGLVTLIDYSWRQRDAVYLISAALLLDSLTRTVFSVFTGRERGELSALTVVVQRVLAAGLGLGALAVGFGVVAVAAMFAVSTAVALVVAIGLLAWRFGMPRLVLSREARRGLRSRSFAFAAQDLLSVGIARADAVMLSLLATTTVVGLYGAGYRLLEATLFIPLALTGAFSAMFTYLGEDTEPSVRGVYQRSIKLALFLLVPCAVAFEVLAHPLIRLFFGHGFGGAVAPLRLLAPVVVLLGIVVLSTSLIVSRRDPRIMIWVFAAALAVNLGANGVLIPLLDASGAATAMLLTEGLFAVIVLRLASRTVGPLAPGATLGAVTLAAAAMAVVMALLSDSLAPALVAGAAAYLATFVAVERRVAPGDLAIVTGIARRRLARQAR